MTETLPHSLPRGKGVRPVERPRPQLVAVEVGAAHVQEGGTELVLARLVVLLDESDGRQRLQDPVHRALRQRQLTRELGDAEAEDDEPALCEDERRSVPGRRWEGKAIPTPTDGRRSVLSASGGESRRRADVEASERSPPSSSGPPAPGPLRDSDGGACSGR